MVILAMGWVVGLIWCALAAVAVLLILLILIQDSKSGGLSTAFGAAGGDTLLGARAQKDLAKLTTYLAIGFVVLCVVGGKLDKEGFGESVVSEEDRIKAESPSDGATSGEKELVPGEGAGEKSSADPKTPPGLSPPSGGTPPGDGGSGTVPAEKPPEKAGG